MHHSVSRPALLGLAASVLALTASSAQALPTGWSLVPVASGLSQPTAFAFRAGQIFVTEKASGQVRIVRPDGSLRPVPLLTVSVSSQSERGLLGITLDPDFASNKFIYVYYTTGPGALNYTGSPKNRVSRFTFVPGTATAIGETVIVDNIPSDAGNHNGGDIQFGFDGTLYIAVGDGGQDHAAAQRLDSLRGKILRVYGDGTSPPDNPYKNEPGARRCGRPTGLPPGTGPCKEIYAYGFRNPFRFSLRQANSSVIVADVGEVTWEELDTLVAGGNYGWNTVEGPCPLANTNCNPNTTPYPAQFEHPLHFYKHSGTGETGQTVIAGAFAENGSNYPAPYAGAYFYGDFSANWVHVLTMDATNTVTSQLDFATLTQLQPVCFRNGLDGNVYVLSFGGTLYKLVFTQ
jgi:glucose/arabinose dehydrogenase